MNPERPLVLDIREADSKIRLAGQNEYRSSRIVAIRLDVTGRNRVLVIIDQSEQFPP